MDNITTQADRPTEKKKTIILDHWLSYIIYNAPECRSYIATLPDQIEELLPNHTKQFSNSNILIKCWTNIDSFVQILSWSLDVDQTDFQTSWFISI